VSRFDPKFLFEYGTPQGAVPVICALSTREQGGVNTVGFNYLDKPGGKIMRKAPLALLMGLGLSSINPFPFDCINQILSFTQNAHYCEVLVNFEHKNRIGFAWFEMCGVGGDETYNFNYMRLDSIGNVLVDMRNFKVKPAHLEKYGIDWELSLPKLYYITNEDGSSWLIHSYDTDSTKARCYASYVGVDSLGKVIIDGTIPSISEYGFAYPSRRLGFHLFGYPWASGVRYFNPSLDEPVRLSKKLFLFTKVGIELPNSRSLLITSPSFFNKWIGPDAFEYRIISDKGKLIKEKTLPWKEYVSVYWPDGGIPPFHEAFRQDSIIYFLFSYEGKINLIKFTNKGEPIKPKECLQGTILPIDDMPKTATRFIKIPQRKRIVYYYGFDDNGNLYYWNSKEAKHE